MDLKFSKIRDVKSPCRAHDTDAGIDFFVPNSIDPIILKPHERILIPSGIRINIPSGYCFVALNKSGLSSKYGLLITSQVIDSGYSGEVHLGVVNTSLQDVTVHSGQKLVQFIYLPVIKISMNEIDDDKLFNDITERGTGGFGSSGA